MQIVIGDDIIVYSIFFADDQFILVEDEDYANFMFWKLVKELKIRGMEIHMEKSKYMAMGTKLQDSIKDK